MTGTAVHCSSLLEVLYGILPAVPYASNDDLPAPLRRHLPSHAQDIFRAAFNSAWESYGAKEPWRREEIAHRVAWAAVKKRYRKAGDDWVERTDND